MIKLVTNAVTWLANGKTLVVAASYSDPVSRSGYYN